MGPPPAWSFSVTKLVFSSMSALFFCLIHHLVWNSSGENRGIFYWGPIIMPDDQRGVKFTPYSQEAHRTGGEVEVNENRSKTL